MATPMAIPAPGLLFFMVSTPEDIYYRDGQGRQVNIGGMGVPQGLKPQSFWQLYGTTEVVP